MQKTKTAKLSVFTYTHARGYILIEIKYDGLQIFLIYCSFIYHEEWKNKNNAAPIDRHREVNSWVIIITYLFCKFATMLFFILFSFRNYNEYWYNEFRL